MIQGWAVYDDEYPEDRSIVAVYMDHELAENRAIKEGGFDRPTVIEEVMIIE